MQDPSDSMEIAEPEENGQSTTAGSPVVDDPTPDSEIDLTTASTVLAEVLPGVTVVFGEVPAELKPHLIDFGLLSDADRMQISTVLASIGNTATVAGNLGNASVHTRSRKGRVAGQSGWRVASGERNVRLARRSEG